MNQSNSPSAGEQAYPELLILTYSCPLNWDEMEGTHAIKHCSQCSLSVPNISQMSEAEHEELFDRARRGEKVCARTEARGPTGRSATPSLPRRAKVAAVVAVATAWSIGISIEPALASVSSDKPKQSHLRNTFTVPEQGPGFFKRKNASHASEGFLSCVDKYGMFVSPSRAGSSQSQIIWSQINALKYSTACSRKPPESTEILRQQIISRAENDRVVATDEVIELSNKYRKAGFDAAADQALSLANTLLDWNEPRPYPPTIVGGSAGQLENVPVVPLLSYSQTRTDDLKHFRALLSLSTSKFNEKEYALAAECLSHALLFSLNNPLVTKDISASDIKRRVEELSPFLQPDKLKALNQADQAFRTRRNDLSKLKVKH